MTKLDSDRIRALMGAVSVSARDAMEAGITPDTLRDVIDGLERAHRAADIVTPRSGLGGRKPITLAILTPDAQAPCDVCGSATEVQLGRAILRHHDGCESRTVPYRFETDAHQPLNDVHTLVVAIRAAYDTASQCWDRVELGNLYARAENAAARAEDLADVALERAETLLPSAEYGAARGAAMIARQYVGEAKGLLRSLRIIVDARKDVVSA